MSATTKIAIFAGAGVLAVGGAGLYAGALSVTGPGTTTGSGSVNLTAACKEAVTLVPGPSYYNSTDQISEYTTLTLSSDTDFSACDGQHMDIVVFANKAVTAGASPSYGYASGQQLGRMYLKTFGDGTLGTLGQVRLQLRHYAEPVLRASQWWTHLEFRPAPWH